VSEQENFEQHLRKIAQAHEAPCEPNDWADMQNRLQKAGLTNTAQHSPLQSNIVRRTAILVALVFLIGVKIWHEPNSQNSQNSQKNQIVALHIQKTPLQFEKTNGKQRLATSKTTPAINTSTIRTVQNVATSTVALNKPDLPIAMTELTKVSNTQNDETATPLGFSTIEPFMLKEVSQLPALDTLNIMVAEIEQHRPKRESYQHIAFYASEALQSNIAFKIGSERMYSVFAVGYQFSGGGRLGIGYGFGKELRKTNRKSLNLEAMCYYIRENNASPQLNLLTQGKIQLHHKFTSNLSGFAGLSFNMLVSDYKGEDLVTSAGIPDWAVLRTSINNTNIKCWTGLNIGLSLRLR